MEVIRNSSFVILHKPTWTYPNADHDKLGWTAVERALQGRRYTVFSGHKHQYARFVRHGQEYYMLATTGGASNLSGLQNVLIVLENFRGPHLLLFADEKRRPGDRQLVVGRRGK